MAIEKTSVLFIDPHQKKGKKVQAPTTLILNWKLYLLIAAGIIFILSGILIGTLIYFKTKNHYTTVFQERIERANEIERSIDLAKVTASFESIDEAIAQMNKLLQERGLAPLHTEPEMGGAIDFDVKDINAIASDYLNKIEVSEKDLKNIPIGWPIKGTITSNFGYRDDPFGGKAQFMHTGMDIRGSMGKPVKATADGEVIFTGRNGGYGNCVVIEHPNHIKTLFGHLSKIDVKEGQKVAVGNVIGKVGSTGRSTGPHLHYEIIMNGKKINPVDFLNFN